MAHRASPRSAYFILSPMARAFCQGGPTFPGSGLQIAKRQMRKVMILVESLWLIRSPDSK